MLELTSLGKVNVMGRGDIYLIDLRYNHLSQKRSEFMKQLPMQSEVSIDGVKGIVRGVEAFATGEEYMHRNIGILLKEI